MSLHYLQYSQSIIVNVIRAIVSRSISTTSSTHHIVKSLDISSGSQHTLSSSAVGGWLNASSCRQKSFTLPALSRHYYSTSSTQTSRQAYGNYELDSLLDDMHTKVDDHLINNKNNTSTTRTVRTNPKGKTKVYDKVYLRAHDKYVTGYHFKTNKKKPQTVEDYKKRMVFAVTNNQQNKAIKYLREMEHRQMKPDTQAYTIIINGFSKQSDMVRARKWMNRMVMNGNSADVYTYTSMIDGYMRQCNVDKAEGIFKTMMDHKVQPNLVTYNVLMQHSVLKLDMETAAKFWGKLSEAGLQPDVYTYAILIHGLGDDGLVDEAWRIFEKMKQEQVDVNHVVASTLMGIHVKHKDNAYAIQLFQDFFGDGLSTPTSHTHNILLNAAMGHTDVTKINEYYQQFLSLVDNSQTPMTESTNASLWGNHPNVSNHVYTYTSFMRAYLRHDNLGMVSQVYQDMVQRKVKPTLVTFATLMLAHAFVPDPHACENMLKELQSHDIKVNVALYTIVMRAWAKAKNWDQVKRVYDEMKSQKIEPNKMTMEVLRWAKEEVVI